MIEASLRKRAHEPEALPDYNNVQLPKRFHSEEKDRFLHLLQFDKEEEFAPSEELVNGFMRSLEEEIAPKSSSNFEDIFEVSDISRGHGGETVALESEFDLSYLLEASDGEVGIPPNPVLDLKDEVCLSTKETSSKGLLQSPDLKFLGQNWHFEDDFENYQQIAVYEDPWNVNHVQDYMTTDFVSQSIFFDGDFSPAWKLETGCGISIFKRISLKDEVSTKETSKGLLERGENQHFEDYFENYQQFAVYEDHSNVNQVQGYMTRGFFSQSMLFDGDFSPAW